MPSLGANIQCGRLARIATIIDESTDRFQIVLLTCHPERYRGFPNAKFFDLEMTIAL